MTAETVDGSLTPEQREALQRVADSGLPVAYVAEALLRGD